MTKNVESIKKIIPENKSTIPFFRIQNWKNVWVETKKVNKSLPNISMGNIVPFYAGAKFFYDRISVSLRNLN